MTGPGDWEDIDPEEVPVPGSRPRVQHAEPAPIDTFLTRWDSAPRTYRVNGVSTELFTAGALAVALNRPLVTLRKWERKGWLPKPLMRAPRSDSIKGYRLYSRDFIEGVVKIAQEEGLFVPGTRGMSERCQERIALLFERTGG